LLAREQRRACSAHLHGDRFVDFAVRVVVRVSVEQLPVTTAFRAVQVRSVEENDPSEGDPFRPHSDQCALLGVGGIRVCAES
jgi:hypothetical protein